MPSPDEFASLLAGRRRYPIDDPIAGYSAPNDPAEPGVAPYMAAAPQFRPAPRTGQSIQEMLDQIRRRQQEFHAPAPTVPEQIGDILAKTGQVAKGVATAPVNAVANLYDKVAEEHSGSPSLSSDEYRDPNAMAHDPEVPATALGLMGAGVPFAKPGALGAAGGKLVVPAAERAAGTTGPFYSAVEQAVGNAKLAKAPMDQWYNFLKGQPGVKAEELAQLGITPGNTGVSLTREQMLGHVNANQVHLNEITKGIPTEGKALDIWNQAQNTLGPQADPEHLNAVANSLGNTKYSQYQLPGGSNYQEKLLTLPEYKENGFQSDHWDEPNVLLHIRHNDRMVASPNGVGELPSLHLEELQSDWHQIGRKDGYQQPGKVSVFKQVESARDKYKEDPTADNKSAYDKILNQWLSGEEPPVPKVPFKASWPDLALKRMLHKAATDVNPDGTPKYHALSWTPGDAQNARYPREDAEANEGMKKFYDEMLVSKANALGKKYGTKVGSSPDQGLHMLPITPELRAAAAKGFPLFATGAVAGPAISQGLDDRAAKALATKPPDL